MRMIIGKRLLVIVLLATVAGVSTLFASHSWGTYHWARTANPFKLKTGDNVDAKWDAYLDTAIGDWNKSTVLDLLKVAGGSNPRNCRPTSGRIEVCNSTYGSNGWLGLAQIWASGSHITQAVSKLNDTYFNTAKYDKPEWRRLVMCQEIAHDFGLDHQDEAFDNTNLGSCMDYTSNPLGPPSNEHPNAHDYEQLEKFIYGGHLDSTTTISQTSRGAAASQIDHGQFGQLIRSTNGGRTELYVLDLGNDEKVFTHVIWAEY